MLSTNYMRRHSFILFLSILKKYDVIVCKREMEMIYGEQTVFRTLVVCMQDPTSDCLTNCAAFMATDGT